jgi:hypothetical protein
MAFESSHLGPPNRQQNVNPIVFGIATHILFLFASVIIRT